MKSIVYLQYAETTTGLEASMSGFTDSYTKKWSVIRGWISNKNIVQALN
jgi:hypothetical protein